MKSRIPPRTNERGASAVEYGLLITGIAALIVLTVFAFGGILSDTYDKPCDDLASRAGQPAC